MENKENNDRRGLGLRKDQSSQKANIQGKSWFFGIGINNYDEFSNLSNAVNDIESIQNLLVNKYDIESDCAITIFDEDATRENIIDQLDVLVKKIQADDKLIIYYSGHGHLDKNTDRGYWIPHNAQPGKTAHYIRNSTIREFVKDLKARHVLLISDSCFSGTLFVRGANRSTAAVDELETIPSRWAICSGRHDEEVYDGNPGENSPFAKSILETLSNNQKPVFNVVKLADRVVEQTRSNYQQLPEGNPLFGVGHKGGQYIFHLKKDEVADWKACLEIGTLTAYNTFLLKYPDGKYAADTKANIKKLQAGELWKQIEGAKTENLIETNKKLQLINQYVDAFEDQPDYGKALDLGELLEYKKQFFQAQSSEFALRKFLRRSVPNVEGASTIFTDAKQLLKHIDAESDLKRKEEEERLAKVERMRIAKEEELTKQKVAAEQKLIERNRLAGEEKKAKQKAAAERLQQIKLKQEQKEKLSISEKKTPSQSKKYGLIAGLSVIGLIAIIFIIKPWLGGSSNVCTDPVQIFKSVDGTTMGLKLCEKVILPPTYDIIFLFSEGLAVAKKGDKFGFIDEEGDLLIDTIYENAESFANGKALVKQDGEEFSINLNGDCIEKCPLTEDEVWADVVKENAYVSYKDYLIKYPNGKYATEANNKLKEFDNKKNTKEAENEYKEYIGRAEKYFKEAEYVFEKKTYDQAKKYYESALNDYRKAIGLLEDDRKAKNGEQKTIERLNEIDKLTKQAQNDTQSKKEEEALNETSGRKSIAEISAARKLREIADESAWGTAKKVNSIEAYQHYQKEYPNGKYFKEATEEIKKLNPPKSINLARAEKFRKLSSPKYVTDKRSGYKSVNLVGKTWLAENLNVKVPNSWCWNKKDENCDKYGRYYTWAAAKNACAILGQDWRLPTNEEWEELILHFGGYVDVVNDKYVRKKKMHIAYSALIVGGKSGFNADFFGLYMDGKFTNGNPYNYGYFWSSTDFKHANPIIWQFYMSEQINNEDKNRFIHRSHWTGTSALSCRCIKD